MAKANKLTVAKQQLIAKHRMKYPNHSMSAIAEQYNVTIDQVNYAIQKYKKGVLKLGRVRTKKVNLDDIPTVEIS